MISKSKDTEDRPGYDPGTWFGLGAALVVLAVWAIVDRSGEDESATAADGALRMQSTSNVAPPVRTAAAATTAMEQVPAVAKAAGGKKGSGLPPSWERDERWKSATGAGESAMEMWSQAKKLREETGGDPYRIKFQARTAASMLEEAVNELASLRKDYDHSRTALAAIDGRMTRYHNTVVELRKEL